MVEEKSL